ncbi:resistance-associated 1-like [Octopus vulgaris]|uniref:ABC-type glutathione-S-conjugate transporter n=1 Tax=Octopus vulgaris TaxID=6645 RepID=A0AA36BPC4_OCTVU|nr:resistance-associated 1-like [Octopus vulgaris]
MGKHNETNFEYFCGGTPIWNTSLTWGETKWPELTQCFQDTLLIWVPCGFLLLTTPFYLYYLLRQKDRTLSRPLTTLSVVKLIGSLLLSVLTFIDLTSRVYKGDQNAAVIYFSLVLLGVSYGVVALLTEIERRRGMLSSVILFIFWFMQLVVNIIPFYSKIELKEYEETDEHKNGNKIDFVLFYMTLIKSAHDKPLQEDEMFELNPSDQADVVLPKFRKNWLKEKQRCDKLNAKRKVNEDAQRQVYSNPKMTSFDEEVNETSALLGNKTSEPEDKKKKKDNQAKPSLLRALFKSFGWTLFKSHCCKICYDLLQFVNPLMLRYLIEFIESGNASAWKGYTMAVGMLFVSMFVTFFSHQNYHIGMRTGIRVQKAIIAAIYEKSLTIKPEEKKDYTTGEIVNFMAVDSMTLNNATPYLWIIWSAPLQIVIALILLYNTLNSSIFAGVVIIILTIPINAIVGAKLTKLRNQQMIIKDKRIKLINEILNGIKVLKLYAWEPSFQEKINDIRNQEMNILRSSSYLQAFSMFTWTTIPYLVTIATFVTYILTDRDQILDAQKAFVSLTLFNIIRSPINLLPLIVVYLTQCWVSVKRINDFLNAEDLDPDNVIYDSKINSAISIQQGTFSWEKGSNNVLEDITLEIPKGSLTAIVGPVGCGKSSLMSTIIGELNKKKGTVQVNGSIAFVPQAAWIQNNTVKNNILFEKPLSDKYDTIVDACALRSDFDILPAGDQTEIGEKGINLSGGQKQRVSLARAVYNDADIYLLDDPLSAVDAHVGKHIFEEVVGHQGLLKDKTRVLVTHGVQWLPKVDNIIIIVDGRISERGSYQELLDHDGAFAQFLKTYLLQGAESESEDEDEETRDIKREMLSRLDSTVSENVDTSGDESNLSTLIESRKLKSSLSMEAPTRVRRQSSIMKDDVQLEKSGKRPSQTPPVQSKLIEEEKLEVGDVKFSVYYNYLKAMGLKLSFCMLITCALYQFSAVYPSFIISSWTTEVATITNDSDALKHSENVFLEKYGGFCILQSLFIFIFTMLAAYLMVRAANVMHAKMLYSILRAPMSFFDTTPLGRIVNRFSKDTDVMDNLLPSLIRTVILMFASVISILIAISISIPIFLAVAVPLIGVYVFIQNYYIPTTRQLKRIESTTRSLIYNHFSETLTGTSCIRAFNVVRRFGKESSNRVDHSQTFQWLGIRLETIGNLMVFAAAMFSVGGRDNVTGGDVGLSISYALQIVTALSMMVSQWCNLQSNIVAIERIREYSHVDSEADWDKGAEVDSSWPKTGTIEFNNYKTRYRPGLDLVLRGITCKINSGEKIGIVGRTGAGKSSLSLSLFRIIEASAGSILIDGQCIADLALHDLRKNLTILPQDPVLFFGPIRLNLDPFDQHTDAQLWTALEQANMKTFVAGLDDGLQHQCDEGGSNLSIGQRQLICLARTLLHKTKILILDEATAAIDMETDELIQQIIRSEFDDCTILTIAHRINTIMDYDRIMVLDTGSIKEFASPQKLLKNEKSMFYGLAKDAGIVS